MPEATSNVSMTSDSKADCIIWPNFNFDQDSTNANVRLTCFYKKCLSPGTICFQLKDYGIFLSSLKKASNLEVNNPTWPRFEFERHIMPVLDTCKLDDVLVETKWAISGTKRFPF